MMQDKENKIFEALNALETELIALKDIVDIMEKIPPEHPRPVYLVKRVSFHTGAIDQKFRQLWELLKKVGL